MFRINTVFHFYKQPNLATAVVFCHLLCVKCESDVRVLIQKECFRNLFTMHIQSFHYTLTPLTFPLVI